MTDMSKFSFVDLFCGIGGFHQALSNIGGECVFSSDIDKDCREVYYNNYGIKPFGDITKIDEKDIPYHDVLCAGFPCQSFSKAGNRLGFADKTKGTLFFDVIRILNYCKPKYIILENVRNLISHDNGNTWNIIYNSLNEIGYNISKTPVIFSPHYIGIPQHRERVFICGIRKDIGELPDFTFDYNNMPDCDIDSILQNEDEIDDVEKYRLSSKYVEWIDNWNDFISNIKCDKLPGFPIWSDYFNDSDDINDDNPKWKNDIILKNKNLYHNNKSFIDNWLIRAKTNSLFYGAKAKLEWQAGVDDKHPDLWEHIMQIRPSGLRVKPGTYFPALVAITQTSIVGKRKRFLTPRECARLQSFPDNFICSSDDKIAYKQFGNSVNVKVVELFAKYLFKTL